MSHFIGAKQTCRCTVWTHWLSPDSMLWTYSEQDIGIKCVHTEKRGPNQVNSIKVTGKSWSCSVLDRLCRLFVKLNCQWHSKVTSHMVCDCGWKFAVYLVQDTFSMWYRSDLLYFIFFLLSGWHIKYKYLISAYYFISQALIVQVKHLPWWWR